MSTEIIGQQEALLQQEAKKQHQRAVELKAGMGRNAMEFAVICFNFKSQELWRYCGFESVGAWRDHVGVSKSAYHINVRIVENLPRLPKAELLAISKENADWLVKLPESKRYDPEMLEMAKSLKEHDFIPEVTKFLPGAARPEDRVWFRRRMYLGQEKIIVAAMEKAGFDHSIPDDDGRRLEVLASHYLTSDESIRKAFSMVHVQLLEVLKIFKMDIPADEQLDGIAQKLGVMASILTQVK